MTFERRSGRTRDEVPTPTGVSRALCTLASIAMLIPASAAYAQEQPVVHAPTIQEILSNSKPLESVSDIKSQPLALLAKFPEAGVNMVRYVAEVIARQPSVVDAILSIMDTATHEQAAAIGAGMARSARAFESKQANSANAISGKVSQSSNVWLKTTFRAIGPGYVENAPLIMPEPIAPQPLKDVYVGQELPEYEGRVGPAKANDPYPMMFGKRIDSSAESSFLSRRGMIVAIMASDKDKNGAVSTSPTN